MRALLLAVLLLPGCTGLQQGCTEIGAEPFVRVTGGAAPGAQLRVCLEGSCEQGPWRDGQAVLLLALPEDGAVDLEVAVLDAAGEVLDEDVVEAEVEAWTPNGERCPPRVGVVDLRREAGGYVQVPAPEARRD